MMKRIRLALRQNIAKWAGILRANRGLAIGMFVLALVAVMIVLGSTRFGAATGTDSIVYLAAARNFLSGEGVSWIGPQGDVRPIAIFAPFYPVVLASISLLTGLDVWDAARWLLVILFILNILQLVSLVYGYSKRSDLALVAGVLFLFSRPMIENHSGVASEPLFLTFLLASLLSLARFTASSNSRALIRSGIFMGLAFLTRYAGVYFMVGGVFLIFLSSNNAWKERIKPILVWSGVISPFVLGWVLRNSLLAGSGTARSWMPMFPPKMLIENFLSDVSFWFFPAVGPLWARIIIVVMVFSGILIIRWFWLRRSDQKSIVLKHRSRGLSPFGLIILICVYLFGLFITRSLFVPRIDIVSRTLFPAHVLVMLLLFYLLADLIDLGRIRSTTIIISRAVWVGTIIVVSVYVLRGLELIANLQEDGLGYASVRWRESPLMNAMDLLPADTPIYTNHVEAIYLYTGRHPYRLPYGCLPEDVLLETYAQANCQEPAYLEWVQTMRHKLEEEQAVIVLFGRTYEQVYDPLIPELIEGLEPLSIQGDGVMYVQDVDEWPDNPHW